MVRRLRYSISHSLKFSRATRAPRFDEYVDLSIRTVADSPFQEGKDKGTANKGLRHPCLNIDYRPHPGHRQTIFFDSFYNIKRRLEFQSCVSEIVFSDYPTVFPLIILYSARRKGWTSGEKERTARFDNRKGRGNKLLHSWRVVVVEDGLKEKRKEGKR